MLHPEMKFDDKQNVENWREMTKGRGGVEIIIIIRRRRREEGRELTGRGEVGEKKEILEEKENRGKRILSNTK